MDLTERLVVLLAAAEIDELSGGHQSRVCRVVRPASDVVVAKVLDAAMVDRHELDARLDVTAALADLDPRVCRPVPIDRQLVTEVTTDDGRNSYVVCFEFADGTALDRSESADAELMGRTLSRLHASMDQLPPSSLPLVAALQTAAPGAAAVGGQHQLLHGDFNATNLRKVKGVVRIFDLDDCGYGPPVFDVANALYMVLFDAVVHTAPKTYRTFRESFVSGLTSRGCDTSRGTRAASVWMQQVSRNLAGGVQDLLYLAREEELDVGTGFTGAHVRAWRHQCRNPRSQLRLRGFPAGVGHGYPRSRRAARCRRRVPPRRCRRLERYLLIRLGHDAGREHSPAAG